jgi:hypothetical protein
MVENGSNGTKYVSYSYDAWGNLKIGPAQISAISRVDVIGFETKGFDAEVGHFGRSAFSIGFNDYSIGVDNRTYESYDGERGLRNNSSQEICWSSGGEIGVVIAFHASVSVSLSGMYNSLVEYGRRSK